MRSVEADLRDLPVSWEPAPLEILSRPERHRVTVFIRGEIDLETAPQVRMQLAELLAHPPVNLVVDLTGVRFMDVSGLYALMDCRRRARIGGGDLVLGPTSPQVKRLLQLLRMTLEPDMGVA